MENLPLGLTTFELSLWIHVTAVVVGLVGVLVILSDYVVPGAAERSEHNVVGAGFAVGGAVLVFNRRFGASEPWVLARGIRRACGRFVRTVGVPDVAPVGPVLRRFGGVLDRTDEIAGLLRAGQLVGLPMTRALRSREAVGSLDAERLEAAIETGAPVVPVALVGRELGRSWRIVVGSPLVPNASGGPLAAAELAEDTARATQVLLDESLPTSWWY